MKVKFQMLAMVFIATVAFGAYGDDDKNGNIAIPDAVSKALKGKYPAATGIEWERKGSYFVAGCWVNSSEMDVWYGTQATWKLTGVDTSWKGLPAAVQTAFRDGEYAAWKLEDIDMLECPERPIQYVIKMENGNQEYQLFCDQGGNVLDERNVSGDKDDTH